MLRRRVVFDDFLVLDGLAFVILRLLVVHDFGRRLLPLLFVFFIIGFFLADVIHYRYLSGARTVY